MAYWECLASFVMDQPSASLSYLDPFCQSCPDDEIYPNPWTGVGTPIVISLARVGILLRQKRVIHSLGCLSNAALVQDQLRCNLLSEARNVLAKVLEYTVPVRSRIEDTGDRRTTAGDLQITARIYRFVALLELYQAFPELLSCRTDEKQTESPLLDDASSPKHPQTESCQVELVVTQLAMAILALISELPANSAAITMLCIPLLCAGSALDCRLPSESGAQLSTGATSLLHHELANMTMSRGMIEVWRTFAHNKLLQLYRHVKIESIRHVMRIMQVVWARADVDAAAGTRKNGPRLHHWMDVMMENKLATLFG